MYRACPFRSGRVDAADVKIKKGNFLLIEKNIAENNSVTHFIYIKGKIINGNILFLTVKLIAFFHFT